MPYRDVLEYCTIKYNTIVLDGTRWVLSKQIIPTMILSWLGPAQFLSASAAIGPLMMGWNDKDKSNEINITNVLIDQCNCRKMRIATVRG